MRQKIVRNRRWMLPLSFALLGVAGFAARAEAEPTIILPGATVYPESVTAAADGTLYNGSFANGGVMRTPPGASTAQPFIAPGSFGTRSTFGVVADDRAHMLWVCSNDMSALGVPGPSDVKGSALKGFDLTTGAGKVSVALPGERTFCNDIAIGGDGSLYVTNSFAPEILRLPPGDKRFEVWKRDPAFAPPQTGAGLDGIAFGADGNLYTDLFTKGELLRVEVHDGRAGRVTKLRPSRPLALTDALHATDGGRSFLLIEGTGRLDRVTISGDAARIETISDKLDQPTAVAEVKGTAWVAEGQLPHLLDPSNGPPHLPFRLRAVPLADDHP